MDRWRDGRYPAVSPAVRVSRYNHFVPAVLPGQYLAYNALTGAFLVLDEDELAEADRVLQRVEEGLGTGPLTAVQRRLVDRGFVVDDARDERAVLRSRYHDARRDVTGLSLTVAPTLNCNFDCDYCFQEHSPKRMSDRDVDDLVDFVGARLRPGTSLAVTWFGGEPLVAFDVIEGLAPRLAQLCEARSCSFVHSMITNGYLLTADRARFLGSIPTFQYAQITLDGSPDQHDHRRVTLARRGTFDRIVENVVTAIPFVDVSVRVNVDRTNAASVEELLVVLKSRGLASRVFVYLAHVWEYTAEVEGPAGSFLSKEEFAGLEARFQFLKFRLGFRTGASLPKPRSGPQCVADRPDGYVVAPGGLVFNCWNEVHLGASDASARYSTAPRDGRPGGTSCVAAGPVAPEPGRRKAGAAVPVALSAKPDPARKQREWDSYDPFGHRPCESCAVAPLCMSGCPWESRKAPPWDPGFCTPLRYNIGDRLRLYHLETVARRAAESERGDEVAIA